MIGISSSWLAMKGVSIKPAIEKIFELGFQLVEVGAAHKHEDKAVETVLGLREKYPDKSFMLHAVFPPFKNGAYPLNLADPKEQDRTLKTMKKMFNISERLGSTIVGIHGGYLGEVMWVDGQFGFKELEIMAPIHVKTAKRNMKIIVEDLLSLAEERNMKLAIEISPSDASNPIMMNAEGFEWIFSSFESKRLGMLLDIGHLHISSRVEGYDPYEFVKQFKNKIFEMHLHDYKDGMPHFAVGEGEIDFAKYFKIIGRSALQKMPMVFEYNNTVTEQQALNGKVLIENMLAVKL